MANAIVHRGPDEDGYLERPGIGLASRRLSIVGLQDGRQPITNEDGTVAVVFNGELFDFPRLRAALEARGHRFITHCDTEILPHLWEEYQEEFFEHVHGQFAFALWDANRRRLILARDRFGICPLFWTRLTRDGTDWLLFASEVKALLASGWIDPRPEPRGIDHTFTFFALPGPLTCFKGIQMLLPGRFLSVDLEPGGRGQVHNRAYWEVHFPDRGQEDYSTPLPRLIEDFQAVLARSVERRLRADVPVVAYLSGGVDSSTVLALVRQVRGEPVPTFSIRIQDPRYDEAQEATTVARALDCRPVVVDCGPAEVQRTYPELIQAAECPVIDTACAALLLLAREVHSQGYKVALTGEGADEWLAGYPWYKIHKIAQVLDCIPKVRVSHWCRRVFVRLTGGPAFSRSMAYRLEQAMGGPNAWMNLFGLVSLSKLRFYSRQMNEMLGEHLPYEDLDLDLERLGRWHPLNRSLYFGVRVMLPGLLLSSKGDRVAMHSSVETRYPFLDEEVFEFCAKLAPRWKLHGLRDKYLLRSLAERWLPRQIAWRPKAMFRAPFDSFFADPAPTYVDQLLSPESLERTGYFDVAAVTHWRSAFRQFRPSSYQRLSIEMGLVAVLGTQLWHHTFIEPALADLPHLAASPPASADLPSLAGPHRDGLRARSLRPAR
jgi:asparagine synthase (glutamine-hydrolysing)